MIHFPQNRRKNLGIFPGFTLLRFFEPTQLGNFILRNCKENLRSINKSKLQFTSIAFFCSPSLTDENLKLCFISRA